HLVAPGDVDQLFLEETVLLQRLNPLRVSVAVEIELRLPVANADQLDDAPFELRFPARRRLVVVLGPDRYPDGQLEEVFDVERHRPTEFDSFSSERFGLGDREVQAVMQRVVVEAHTRSEALALTWKTLLGHFVWIL